MVLTNPELNHHSSTAIEERDSLQHVVQVHPPRGEAEARHSHLGYSQGVHCTLRLQSEEARGTPTPTILDLPCVTNTVISIGFGVLHGRTLSEPNAEPFRDCFCLLSCSRTSRTNCRAGTGS